MSSGLLLLGLGLVSIGKGAAHGVLGSCEAEGAPGLSLFGFLAGGGVPRNGSDWSVPWTPDGPRRPAPKQRAPPLEGAMGWDCGAKTLGVAFVSPRGCGEMVPCGGVGGQVGAVALEEELRRRRGSF